MYHSVYCIHSMVISAQLRTPWLYTDNNCAQWHGEGFRNKITAY